MEYFNNEKTGCGLEASKPDSVKHRFKGTKEMVSRRGKSHSHGHEDRGPIDCNVLSNPTAYRLHGPVNTWDSLVKCWCQDDKIILHNLVQGRREA